MSTYSSDPALDYDIGVDGGIDVATCCFGTDVRLIVRGGYGWLQPEEAQAVGEALIRAAGDCRASAAWARGDQDEPHPDEIPLAAAEASCGGCGCAERLRAEAERYRGWMTEHSDALGQVAKRLKDEPGAYKDWLARRDLVLENQEAFHALARAADFLDAAPDARGSDLSAEQPTPVSEQGDAKKRAEWNDPKEGRVIPDGFVEAFQKVSDETRNFLDQEATDG